MPEHTTQQGIVRALRSLEAGQYIAEDSRKRPLRVCEQQPQQNDVVNAVSSRGTVYAFENASSGVRIHRGSSIKEAISAMDSDGFIDKLSVEEEGESLITPLPSEISAVSHLGGYRQPTLIEGWVVGTMWRGYRDDVLRFNPHSLNTDAFQVTVENGDVYIGDVPLEQRGERVAFIMNRL